MKKGFTLIELIIVVIVIGVLATLAVPQYLKAVERSQIGKAKHNLGIIAQAEKLYRSEKDAYVNAGVGGLHAALGDYVEMKDIDVTNPYWEFSVIEADKETFTAKAERLGGPHEGSLITLDQDGIWTEFKP
ncbi:MAG: prepilin-type N-terminal cleavage/methylation domain-containing protein [Candidatus Omnitrophica bacterium]|nr:prepilin-type N-terminal cleavage/methylation domain-containing protein [Candidatus Omnitrophota bacterium]